MKRGKTAHRSASNMIHMEQYKAQLETGSKKSKYSNEKTKVDGISFASRAEARRYGELKLLALGGEIRNLEMYPRFTLAVNDQKICTYVADFRYYDIKRKRVRIEDVKGARTAVFILKKKLLKACHGIDVEEIRMKR